MYSNRLAESSTSTTFRNFRIDNDHADGHNGGNPAKPGDREIFIGKRDTSLPSNRIQTIKPFYKLLAPVLLGILTQRHILYLFVPGILTCIVREQEYLPINICLLFVLICVYLVKVYLTIRKYQKYDRMENEQQVLELHESEMDGSITSEKCRQDLLVGSVITVSPERQFPADVIPIYSKGLTKVRVSTLNLDKDKNIATKIISTKVTSTLNGSEHRMLKLRQLCVVYERPNKSFYSFEGRILSIHDPSNNEFLCYDNLILRGSILKEEQPVVCIVLYTGNQCKKFSNVLTHRTYSGLTMLHKQLEQEVPATLILSTAFVLVGIIVYICRYYTKLDHRDPERLYIVNRFFFYKIFLELVSYLNVLHVWVFLMLELTRALQMHNYRRHESLIVNNRCQSLDQFGRARTVIADELTLFGTPEFLYKTDNNYCSPEPQLPISTIRWIVLASSLFRQRYGQEAQAIEQWLIINRLDKQDNFTIHKEQLSPDNKEIYIFVECKRKDHFLVSVVNQKDLSYSPSTEESLMIEPITEKIREQKMLGSRILAVLIKRLDEDEFAEEVESSLKRQPSEYQIPEKSEQNLFQSLTLKYQSEMKFTCVFVFCYSIGEEVQEFTSLIKKDGRQLWIISERPLISIDEILTSSGIQRPSTNKYIIDRVENNQLKDHLKYVGGILNKNQRLQLESVLYISCDSLYAFSKCEVEHIHDIAQKCIAVVCFSYNNFLRERLLHCFSNKTEGVIFLSQYMIDSGVMLQSDISVSIITQNSFKQAKVVDSEVISIVDLGRLMCGSARLAYRRNCQIAYTIIFANSILIGCQLMVLFIGLPLTSTILQYQYAVDFYNILFVSLPLVIYSTAISNRSQWQQKTPETRYSSWAVWRLAILAVFIGTISAGVNQVWMVGDTRIFDLKISTYTNGVVISNAFIGIFVLFEKVSPLRKLIVGGLLLVDLGLYALWLLITNYIDDIDSFVTIQILIQNKNFTIPCLFITNAMGILLCFTYLQLWPLTDRESRRAVQQKEVRAKEIQCRVPPCNRGRKIYLQE